MPGNELDLEGLRSDIVGSQRGVIEKKPRNVKTNARNKIGNKVVFRDEQNLDDFIELDYNPTTWPFEKTIEFNDKHIIGGDDAIEFKGIKKSEFSLELLFTDFCFHGSKQGYKDSVVGKLNWLDSHSNPGLFLIDDRFVRTPNVIFIEKGIEAQRVVITKISGVEEIQDSQFSPIRARVSVTFRKVIRPRQKGQDRRNF